MGDIKGFDKKRHFALLEVMFKDEVGVETKKKCFLLVKSYKYFETKMTIGQKFLLNNLRYFMSEIVNGCIMVIQQMRVLCKIRLNIQIFEKYFKVNAI